MDLNWLQSVIYGFFSGFMDILPVSAQAHRILLLKIFGVTGKSDLFSLFLHLGVFAGLYFHCTAHLVRMSRARRLSKVPKRSRKRPLDGKSLMEYQMLKTMLIPAILGICLLGFTQNLQGSLLYTSGFLLLNGLLLYIPQFFPTGNKDARAASRVEGLLMGLGGGLSVLPGMSAVGAAASIGSLCGMDRSFTFSMVLVMNLFVNLGYLVQDILGIAAGGAGPISALLLLRYLLTGVVAFCGTLLGIRTLRAWGESHGYAIFGLYCFGLALFTFILNLIA